MTQTAQSPAPIVCSVAVAGTPTLPAVGVRVAITSRRRIDTTTSTAFAVWRSGRGLPGATIERKDQWVSTRHAPSGGSERAKRETGEDRLHAPCRWTIAHKAPGDLASGHEQSSHEQQATGLR